MCWAGTPTGYVCFGRATPTLWREFPVCSPLFFFLLAALVHHHHDPHGGGAAHPTGRIDGHGLAAGGHPVQVLLFTPAALRCWGAPSALWEAPTSFPKILWHAYNIMYGFGIPIEFVLDGKLAAISVATYLLCALGPPIWCAVASCGGAGGTDPAQGPKEGKRCCWSASPSVEAAGLF